MVLLTIGDIDINPQHIVTTRPSDIRGKRTVRYVNNEVDVFTDDEVAWVKAISHGDIDLRAPNEGNRVYQPEWKTANQRRDETPDPEPRPPYERVPDQPLAPITGEAVAHILGGFGIVTAGDLLGKDPNRFEENGDLGIIADQIRMALISLQTAGFVIPTAQDAWLNGKKHTP
jgi:hypothetical protein